MLTKGTGFISLESHIQNVSDQTYLSSRVDEESELYQRFEDFVEEKGHSNDSAAVRDLVRTGLDVHEGKHSTKWDLIAEQSLYAVTFGLVLATVSLVVFVVLLAFSAFPSPLTLIAIGAVFGGVLVAVGGGLGHDLAASRAERVRNEVEA
jgi:uncharacterized integral membrane protein